MKTKLFTICCLFFAALQLSASNTSVDGIWYDLDSSTKTASVTYPGDHSYSGSVIIPSQVVYNGQTYSVTRIGSDAFYGCDGLTSVTIPNSVMSIGEGAFSYCHGLTSITIPNSVTSIEKWAFDDCRNLISITIPESVTSIGGGCFLDCPNLASIRVESSNTTYDSRNNCNAIIQTESNTLIVGCKNTTIPSSVMSIGDVAFYGSGLTSIAIPNSVTSIGEDAFRNCRSLTSITIPSSVTCIGSLAFYGCTSLPVENGIRYANTYLVEAVDKTQRTYIIKEETRWIGEVAFSNCSGLTSITIPNSVTGIKSGVFSDCTGLTSITIPNSVTSIGDYAFEGCSSLTSITIPNSVTSIGSYAFHSCSGLTSINLPNSVTSIGSYAFEGCSSLTSITIPDSVTSIGSFAFQDCSSLKSVTIGNSITHIYGTIFIGCHKLESLTMGKAVQYISEKAFFDCQLLNYVTCYARIPPKIYRNSFYRQYKLYVPCESLYLYLQTDIWNIWTYIECIVEAEESEVSTTTATPSATDVTIAWPITDGAWSYTWTITKDGVVVYTLIFNANGQLIYNTFAPSRNGVAKAQAAELTATGYQFTVTGLESNSTYDYLMKVKDFEDNTIETFSGNFTTNDPTELESVVSNKNVQKILRDGHLFIQREGKTYNMQGAVVNL